MTPEKTKLLLLEVAAFARFVADGIGEPHIHRREAGELLQKVGAAIADDDEEGNAERAFKAGIDAAAELWTELPIEWTEETRSQYQAKVDAACAAYLTAQAQPPPNQDPGR